MTDYPIIFSAPMVRALLEGRKTMTRRLAWREQATTTFNQVKVSPSPWQKVKPGDRLWVRESLSRSPERLWSYRADGTVIILRREDPRVAPMLAWAHHKEGSSAPSIHMPRWASRLTLIIAGTKIERLQDIPLMDVQAEGCEVRQMWLFGADGPGRQKIGAGVFGNLWTSLHGRESWDANPHVVALTFNVVKANIDAPEAVAA